MDAQERKLLGQLDTDVEPVRKKALETLRAYLQKNGRSFRQIVFEDENSVPLQQYNDEVARHKITKAAFIAHKIANVGLAQALWVKGKLRRHWRTVFFWGPIAVVAWVGFGWLTGESRAERIAVNDGLSEVLAATKFGVGQVGPAVRLIRGAPWWTLIVGRLETGSHTDAQARDVTLQCLYLYAVPATANSHAYLKPNPYNWFGWLGWPERAKLCKPVA